MNRTTEVRHDGTKFRAFQMVETNGRYSVCLRSGKMITWDGGKRTATGIGLKEHVLVGTTREKWSYDLSFEGLQKKLVGWRNANKGWPKVETFRD